MDDQAGHIIGHAGSGLKQVHDISGTKISVSTTITTGFHLITIWGTNCQVGDALTAIGKRMACHHLRSPNKKAKQVKAPSSGNPITTTDMLIVCIDMGACNFSDLPLIDITEIMSI